MGVVIGVAVSVVGLIAFEAFGLWRIHGYLPTILGLLVGTAATGAVVRASRTGQWVFAFLLTFLGQVVLGVVIYMVVYR